MFKHFFVILVLGSFCCFLYGIYNLTIEVEENNCRMTYMFQRPQFSRVNINSNNEFFNYKLFYYYEGIVQKDVNKLELNGAPVIFVPGNGGSYKQVRSFASVALRKALNDDRHIHLDYFTIDYNEELSGLYGGYLENQKRFLHETITTVLNLYKRSPIRDRKVVLIGHSMGGKIAQSLLTIESLINRINTIILIATPIDAPVVNIDAAMSSFYAQSNDFLFKNRRAYIPGNNTNVCGPVRYIYDANNNDMSHVLDNILIISVGGGNRDLLVRSELTTSKYSDIHAMTSSIPNVWLSCDHLSAVWCLQFVLVINRFLFSISKYTKNLITFEDDKALRFQTATKYFVKPRINSKPYEIEFSNKFPNENVWHESTKRVVGKQFMNGLQRTYNHMIPLTQYGKYKKLYVEVNNVEDSDWLYGCSALNQSSGKPFCGTATKLSHYINPVILKSKLRSKAVLDLDNIKKTYHNWTHILTRLPATHKSVGFSLDIHDPKERYIHIKAPRWHAFKSKPIIEETVQGTVFYKLFIESLDLSFQSMEVEIIKRACVGQSHSVTAKICVPWAPGYERHYVSNNFSKSVIYVNVPVNIPLGYNTSKLPVITELYLDPSCRYSISYRYSIASTMSRIVHEFYHWVPSHLVAVLCIVLKNQISKLQKCTLTSKSVRPYMGFFQYTSLYIITGCRVLKKLLMPIQTLQTTELSGQYFFIGAIVHSVAIVLSILASFIIWMLITVHGNLIQKILFRFTNRSLCTSSMLNSVVSHLPIAFAVLAISIAVSSCSGIALMLTCLVYMGKLSNEYRDYLENWLWQSGSNSVKRAFRLLRTSVPEENKEVSILNNDNNEQLNANEHVEPIENADNREEQDNSANLSHCVQTFPFHMTMLLFLIILTLLNTAVTLAWIRNYGNSAKLPDTAFVPSVIVIACLCIMWQLELPNPGTGWRILSVILYACSSTAVIYCQEAIYGLNYVIAIVYVAVLMQQLFSKLWKRVVNAK